MADGQTLWLYDADLNQVTARKQSAVLGLDACRADCRRARRRALQADFTLTAAPEKDGLEWWWPRPRPKTDNCRQCASGFALATNRPPGLLELAALEILDSFGQRSVLTFSKVEVNPNLAKDTFQFNPPKGADVIRQ